MLKFPPIDTQRETECSSQFPYDESRCAFTKIMHAVHSLWGLFCLLFEIFNWQGTFNVVDFVKPSAAELSTVGSRVPFFEGVGPDQLFRDP